MQVTETKSEGLSREFKVALPANEIEEKISHRLKELARTAQMPGFRPGKVPVSVLRKKYGPSVLGEVLERAVNDSSQQALAEKGLRPAMQPQIEITSFEDGGDLEYTIAVELLPEIKPVDFSKIKLERLIPKTDDAAMENTLADIAAAQGDSAAIKDDRETKTGDVLVIDFLGRVGGEEFAGGKAEGYELTLGSGTFIPGFEEQLIGVKVGDKIEVKVKFPDSYGAAELSGKDAVFDVTVNELKETVPSAIDDELAKKVGMENLEALKKSIREEQESEFNEMSRMILKRALLDELSAAHDFEIPEKLLDREFDTIWKQFEEQRKKDKDAGQGSEEKTDDEHKKDFREIAERRVRLGLLLSEVGRANNVQISQEDVNSQLMAEARRHPGREKEVMEHYKNNPEAMEELSAPLYEEKVVNFILEQASITEKTATKDGLIKTMEDEAAGKPKAKAKAGGKSKTKGKAAAEKKAAKKDK
ncbi:MAG TPA: trigger factor [Rhodospirillales bacterium]|nr:trigger factor [Rhodospirillales bacterium]